MAYARWGCDGSDVYVFASVGGGVVCCCCDLDAKAGFRTNAEMIEHLLKHREAGHTVPEYAIERLRSEPDNTEEEPDNVA